MSKKTKKTTAQVEGQVLEVTNNAEAEDNQMEVTRADVEVVPATIVESGEAEVFQGQTEGQEVVDKADTETVAAAEGDTTTQPAEQAAEKPASKPRVDRRPYIGFLTEALEKPQDRKELLKIILEKWPTVSKGGCQTFLTDMLNPRYSHWKDRPIIKLADGKVVFADKAPIAEEGKQEPAEPSPVEVVPEAPTQEA